MSRHRVHVNSLAYSVSPDDAAPEAEQLWAIVIGRVIDEITGAAPRTSIRITTAEPGLATRVDADGAMCVIARPWLRFPPLTAPNYTITLNIEAAGYLPFTRTVTIPTHQRSLTANANAGTRILSLNSVAGLYAGQILLTGPSGPDAERCRIANLGPAPGQVTLTADLVNNHAFADPVVADAFAPVDLDDLPVRRLPVVIRGRTIVRTSTGGAPVPNATVNVARLWRTLGDVRKHLPAVAANMVSVKPGLYSQRAVGTVVDEISLTPVGGEDKLLGKPALAGGTRLPLSDRVNLVAGASVLAVDPDDADRREQLLISGLEPTLAATDPTVATVNSALRNDHVRDSRVVRVTPGAPVGASKHLIDEGTLGDQTLFLDSIAFAGGSGMAQVDGGPTVEFQQFTRFQVTSDAEGYYVLPPLHRVAQIEIEASAVGHPPINTANNNTIIFQPDYAVPENWLDVVFES